MAVVVVVVVVIAAAGFVGRLHPRSVVVIVDVGDVVDSGSQSSVALSADIWVVETVVVVAAAAAVVVGRVVRIDPDSGSASGRLVGVVEIVCRVVDSSASWSSPLAMCLETGKKKETNKSCTLQNNR